MSSFPSPAVHLRLEEPGDIASIRQITEAAFGDSVEADLIDALRTADGIALSVVAVLGGGSRGGGDIRTLGRGGICTGDLVGGDPVGHALFTAVTVATGEGDIQLLGLGPFAVLPARQHRGIGTMMISGSLEYLRGLGSRGVVVIGQLAHYRRFGFIQASRWNLRWETDEVPEENLLALELTPGALAGVTGVIHYRPEFSQDRR